MHGPQPLAHSAENHLVLLHCGREYFPALVAAFDAAELEIHLEAYIFATDDVGVCVRDALRRASARGVHVNLIVDWLGTGPERCASLLECFRDTKVDVRIFNPWFTGGPARSHRKLCVVDRRIAFVGGLNISDDLRDDHDGDITLQAPRWDFAVRIVGPLVAQIHVEMAAQWRRTGRLELRLRWALFRQLRKMSTRFSGEAALATLVVRDNLRNRRTIERAYLRALRRAKTSALLATPYFAPGRTMRDALKAAAERGVGVTLLLGVGQYPLQDAVSNAYYPSLLAAGVKIVEYRKAQLHAKVAVIDDHWATVGSSNFDGFSLFLNQEANVVVDDRGFTATLRSKIEDAVADGVVVDLQDVRRAPWYARATYACALFLYRGMIQLVTWGRYS